MSVHAAESAFVWLGACSRVLRRRQLASNYFLLTCHSFLTYEFLLKILPNYPLIDPSCLLRSTTMAAPVVIAPNGLSVTLKDEVEKRGLDRAFDKSNYVYKLDREALDSGLEPKGPNDVSTILHYIDEAKSDKTPYITPVKG